MVRRAIRLLLALSLLGWVQPALAADGRFDLVGPKIDVRVTRGQDTLPVASVPNLQAGDKLWLHPDLPPTQSVKYLLICVFLRGNTNPPPENWFFRIETWNKKVRDEGVFITVPAEAQQAVLFLAPETGGDFSTLKSAVRGRPGVFVRASQDLSEAGFEQARIERYLADIRRVPPSNSEELQKHSDLMARSLALKPNADCFKRQTDQQFNCLTQTGSQVLLDDGHGQSIISALSNGPGSDFINQASYTQLAGAGSYSAYVGAIVDLVRIMGSLHTAQYQYIPAIAFPQGDALNLRLNTPPSFHNPKSVLVIGLPSVQAVQTPPLRPADPSHVACLLQPSVVLELDGAPLVFSTDFATHLVLHLNTKPGAPAEPDIPLTPNAFEGGLMLQGDPEHHVPLHELRQPLNPPPATGPAAKALAPGAPAAAPSQPEPATITGTIEGNWGFDRFTGPTVTLQQLPGADWHIVSPDGSSPELIAGKNVQLLLTSSGTACVHTISATPAGTHDPLHLSFKSQPTPDHPNRLAVSLPADREITPGNLNLEIQQFGQPKPDGLAAKTFADPPQITAVQLAAGDRSILLTGIRLTGVDQVNLGDLVFKPQPQTDNGDGNRGNSLRFSMAPIVPAPPTHPGDRLSAQLLLNDGRHIPLALTVLPPRPSIALLSRSFDPIPGSVISLSSPDDLPLNSHVSFTLKSRGNFPRNGRVEVETLDGTLRAVLTLAPSGGLVLQDPHTVVAGLDPLRSFGPSAFGALQLRAVFPDAKKHSDTPETPSAANQPAGDTVANAPPAPEGNPMEVSDWQPLGTLVRLPVLAHLQCSPDAAAGCSLIGTNLFLLQSISADPAFANPDPVPDGFTGGMLPVPHPAGSAGTLFLKLRDDPTPIDSAVLPTSIVTTQASTMHGHSAPHN